MLLYVVRHAEAAPGEPDELRALTPAGREQAQALAERLVRDGTRLDAVLSSPLLRARETAAAIAKELGVVVQVDEGLAPGATAASVRAAIAGRGEAVAIVGHQPDCSELVSELSGEPAPKFPPAGMHALTVTP
jgi:phosphohistidine phosphatase